MKYVLILCLLLIPVVSQGDDPKPEPLGKQIRTPVEFVFENNTGLKLDHYMSESYNRCNFFMRTIKDTKREKIFTIYKEPSVYSEESDVNCKVAVTIWDKTKEASGAPHRLDVDIEGFGLNDGTLTFHDVKLNPSRKGLSCEIKRPVGNQSKFKVICRE